jgi:PAS domain S-box-containing protein
MPHPSPEELIQAAAQARLAAIVETSDDAIVSKTLEGIVTSWNKGAERIFGYTADEIVGQSITKVIPPDRLEEEPKILARLQRGERVDHFQTIRRTKDGRLIDVSVTISPLRDASGKVIGASKIARDITLQKRFERELNEARMAAEEASRSKDHFLSILSHELRTPLTPVLAAISHIEGSPAMAPEALHEQVAMIRRNVETQARLVDDLLDITRIRRGKVQLHFEVVDAHAAVRNTLAMLQQEADAKSLAVTTSLHARAHHVWADPGRFQQVVLNLLSNAIKFTPEGGAVTLSTINPNGTFRLQVIDSGVGIDTTMVPRLFTAFEQGDQSRSRKFGGLGLGLHIVKTILDMHGARVSADSLGTGRGATFTVEMETIRPPDTRTGAAPTAQQLPAGANRKLLLVEDHTDTRAVLSRLLSSFGFQVVTAGSVQEALALAKRQKFDLLVSDIGLPDGTGMDVMRELAEQQHIKGIAISGFGQEDDLRRSREAGFVRHLTKPVNFQTLREVILKVAN